MGAPKGYFTDDQINRIEELHFLGKSVFEIATTMHCSPRHAYQVLSGMGLLKPMPALWPEDWDNELRAVHDEMPASKVADHMTEKFGFPFTKNNVIARLNRLKLKRTTGSRCTPRRADRGIPKPKRPRIRRQTNNLPKAPRRAPMPPEPDPIGGSGVPLSELGFPVTQCRWPTGRDHNGMLCCGHAVREKTSYCEYHHRIGTKYEDPDSRPRKTNWVGRHFGHREDLLRT